MRFGKNLRCPVCSRSIRRFKPYNGRAGALCPRCGSFERHRLLWAWIVARLEPAAFRNTLHLAAEPWISSRIRSALGGYHVSGDLAPGHDVQLDLTTAPFADGSFDVILCSHVLEHIPDDRAAMAELRRLLSADGVCLIQVPETSAGRPTEEGAHLAAEERTARFGQSDHVRLYGPDLDDRLAAVGLEIERIDAENLLAGEHAKHGVPGGEWLIVARRG